MIRINRDESVEYVAKIRNVTKKLGRIEKETLKED